MLKKQGSSHLKAPNRFRVQVAWGWGIPRLGTSYSTLLSEPDAILQEIDFEVVTIHKVHKKSQSPKPSPQLSGGHDSRSTGSMQPLPSCVGGVQASSGPPRGSGEKKRKERPWDSTDTVRNKLRLRARLKAQIEGNKSTADSQGGWCTIEAVAGDSPQDLAMRICGQLGCTMGDKLEWSNVHSDDDDDDDGTRTTATCATATGGG